jgi:hypothetical protein
MPVALKPTLITLETLTNATHAPDGAATEAAALADESTNTKVVCEGGGMGQASVHALYQFDTAGLTGYVRSVTVTLDHEGTGSVNLRLIDQAEGFVGSKNMGTTGNGTGVPATLTWTMTVNPLTGRSFLASEFGTLRFGYFWTLYGDGGMYLYRMRVTVEIEGQGVVQRLVLRPVAVTHNDGWETFQDRAQRIPVVLSDGNLLTGIGAQGTDDLIEFVLQDLPVSGYEVGAVRVVGVASDTQEDNWAVRGTINRGDWDDTREEGSVVSAVGTWVAEWTSNPWTLAPWVGGDIQGLRAGMIGTLVAINAFSVEVDHIPNASPSPLVIGVFGWEP